jgi:hypothetical protein
MRWQKVSFEDHQKIFNDTRYATSASGHIFELGLATPLFKNKWATRAEMHKLFSRAPAHRRSLRELNSEENRARSYLKDTIARKETTFSVK